MHIFLASYFSCDDTACDVAPLPLAVSHRDRYHQPAAMALSLPHKQASATAEALAAIPAFIICHCIIAVADVSLWLQDVHFVWCGQL